MMSSSLLISAVILTKNNEDTIAKTLDALKNFKEIVILDTGSSDRTLDIAKSYRSVRIYRSTFSSFGTLRNEAAHLATHDWILAIDSDEVLSEDLQNELLMLHLHPKHVYAISFHNYYNGKHIKGCGWYPDFHCRLYHKKNYSFSPDLLHEKLQVENKHIVRLKHPMLHYSYRSVEDFLRKMNAYSLLFAKQYQNKKDSSFTKAFFHGLFSFFKTYFIKLGILDGKEGFIISFYNAQTTFYKYLKLAEINQKK